MGLFEQFDYTNFHELNLDWLIVQCKKLENKVNELEDRINGIKEEILQEVDDKLKAFEEELLAKVQEQLDATKQELTTLINTSIANLETKINEQLTAINLRIDELSNKLEECCNEVKEQIAGIQGQIDDITDRLSTIDTHLTNIDTEIDTINSRLDALEDNVTDINANISSILDTLGSVNDSIGQINTKINGITEKINSLETRVSALEAGGSNTSHILTCTLTPTANPAKNQFVTFSELANFAKTNNATILIIYINYTQDTPVDVDFGTLDWSLFLYLHEIKIVFRSGVSGSSTGAINIHSSYDLINIYFENIYIYHNKDYNTRFINCVFNNIGSVDGDTANHSIFSFNCQFIDCYLYRCISQTELNLNYTYSLYYNCVINELTFKNIADLGSYAARFYGCQFISKAILKECYIAACTFSEAAGSYHPTVELTNCNGNIAFIASNSTETKFINCKLVLLGYTNKPTITGGSVKVASYVDI